MEGIGTMIYTLRQIADGYAVDSATRKQIYAAHDMKGLPAAKERCEAYIRACEAFNTEKWVKPPLHGRVY
jgi:hypothetical protein